MLENTFIHLSNFGPRKEKKLWESGIFEWSGFLDNFGSLESHKTNCSRIAQSKYELEHTNPAFFAAVLARNETWRSFPHFPKIAYVDIETTGLSPEQSELTVVGLYDGSKVYSYIKGINLDEFDKHIGQFDSVVTFNGSIFDLPFLKKYHPGIKIPQLHIDLRFVLQSLNIRGGLKKIEAKFGLERDDDLKGLNGYDAVLLWKKYKKDNDQDALDKLVRYNAADISNLKSLMEWAYREKRLNTGLDQIIGGAR